MQIGLALDRVFLQVSARGLPVAPRDYLDALTALGRGFGLLTRARLLSLCQTLWARSEEEAAIVRAVFDEIAPPAAEELARLMGHSEAPASSSLEATPEPTAEGNGDLGSARSAPQQETSTRVRIGAGEETEGVALPMAQVGTGASGPFVFSPRPFVSRRQMTVLWRRFRNSLRQGPRTEMDLGATVERLCRTGRLEGPVLVPARRNRANLVVLVDVSASMIAWRPFIEDLVSSLHDSRLGRYWVYYFNNVPGSALERAAIPGASVSLESALDESEGSAAIVVSDAGAARGRRGPARAEATAKFIGRARRSWTSLVWLNPMPRARWRGTTAELIAALRGLESVGLGADELTRAVDILRGRAS
jgi:uncharacterized protein with von Willebrand factor type A (vWA) domain